MIKDKAKFVDQVGQSAAETLVPAAIACEGVGKRFGRADALSGLNMQVPQGSVYALLGRNGAGKSTLIQLLMGMLEPTSGSISVLGLDPVKRGVALKQRIGYIPDRLAMYDWMTVGELLKFVGAIYTNWSMDEENTLVTRFRLDRGQKVGALSRGYRALLALVVAMAHNPELVLLDECTSGMDAIARREFERSVIDALQLYGRTVLFAGHQIDEMERICDWIGIMKSGRMLLEMPLDELKCAVKTLRFDSAKAEIPPFITGCVILNRRVFANETHITVRKGSPDDVVNIPPQCRLIEEVPLSLEEIFVALVGEEGETK